MIHTSMYRASLKHTKLEHDIIIMRTKQQKIIGNGWKKISIKAEKL